ncbi:MAG: lipopolysaccharide biosynthesis protein [Hyphomicrobiaceae bacterium]
MTIEQDVNAEPLSRRQAIIADVLARLRHALAPDGERGRAQRAALTAFAIRVLSAGIAYLTQVVLARWMGSYEYGIFVFVWVWVLILGGLSSLGINIAVIRFVPEYKERNEPDLLRGILLGSRLLTVLVSTSVALTGLLGLKIFAASLDNHYVLPLYLALFCLPLYTLTDMQDGIGRGHSWFQLALLPPYVIRPLLILLAMVAAHELDLPMVASTAAGCAIFATWATGLLQLALVQRRLAVEPGPGSYAFETRTWLVTALPIFMISGFELLIQNTDVLVLTSFESADTVGIYYAALKTIGLISFVHYAVGSALASRLSTLNTRGDRQGLESFVRDAANWTFWPSLGAAVLLLLAGPALLSLFGPGFESGYPVMFLMVVGYLIRASVGPAEFVLRMLGEQTSCAVVFGVSAVFNLMANLLLVPQLGLIGAAISSSATLLGASIAFYVIAKRRLGLDIAVWSGMLGRRGRQSDRS